MTSPRHEGKSLSALLGGHGDLTCHISGLTADSRQVRPGDLFAAIPGSKTDGRAFIADALGRGAAALLVPFDTPVSAAVPVVEASSPRLRFAEMAAAFYGAQPSCMAAVTGTNGKTSVAHFTQQIWRYLGKVSASIGTLGVKSDKLDIPHGLTSPDPVTLHKILAELAHVGVTHGVCEASSHGLAQCRLDGVRLHGAAFTNLSRDHLDYHGTMEAYFHAKARLFGELLEPPGRCAIMVDTHDGQRMAAIAEGRGLNPLRVGRNKDAGLRLKDTVTANEGQHLAVDYEGRTYEIYLPLAGPFQADNALLAAGLVIVCGEAPERVFEALAHLTAVPGRLEDVGRNAQGGAIFIDYAHTPDGLKTALSALRPHTDGKLWVVFGCGGDRDRGKRPEMGRIADRMADHVIVTDDNPRSEDAGVIRKEVLAACPDALDIGDRKAAIHHAIAKMGAGDCLVIAGKGHEEGQIVGDQVLPFSDHAVVRECLARGSDHDI